MQISVCVCEHEDTLSFLKLCQDIYSVQVRQFAALHLSSGITDTMHEHYNLISLGIFV